jgi:hypothetical protein
MRREAATRAMPKRISRRKNRHPPAPAVEHWSNRKRDGPGAPTRADVGQLEVARSAKYDFRLRKRIST